MTTAPLLHRPALAAGAENHAIRINVEGGYYLQEGDDTIWAEDFNGSNNRIGDENDGGNWLISAHIDINDQWDIGIIYSGLRTQGSDNFSEPLNAAVYNVLATAATFYNHGKAEAEATYHVVDFEAGYKFKLGDSDARASIGARYANIDQSVNTNLGYPITAPFTFQALEKREVSFNGLGPRFAMEFRVPVFSSWRFDSKVGVATLYGKRKRSTVQSQPLGFPIVGFRRINHSAYEWVTSVDAKVSAVYEFSSNAEIALGYKMDVWFDVNDTSNQSSVTGKSFGSKDAEQIFHGPFINFGYTF